MERGEGDVVVRERRAQDVQDVRPRREHQRLRGGVLGADLDLMSFRVSFSLNLPCLTCYVRMLIIDNTGLV